MCSSDLNTPNTIFVAMLTEDMHLSSPEPDERFEVKISGPEEEIRLIESMDLIGKYSIDEDFESGERLELEDVHFVCGDKPLDERVKIAWKKGNQPHITLERTDEVSIVLTPAHLPVEDGELDPRFEFHPDGIAFNLPTIVIRGPAAQIGLLNQDQLDLLVDSSSDRVALFKPVTLGVEDRKTRTQRLFLSEHLEALGLQLSDETQVDAELAVLPTSWDLDTIEIELPLVDLSGTKGTRPTGWNLVSVLKAEFSIQTKAVIPTTESPDTQSFKERRAAVRRFVKENLIVFVDVRGFDADGPDDTTTAKVQWFWPPRDWRELLAEEIGPMAQEATVEVLLKTPPDGEVLLMKSAEASEAATGTIDESAAPK